jgi:hypothetical protein
MLNLFLLNFDLFDGVVYINSRIILIFFIISVTETTRFTIPAIRSYFSIITCKKRPRRPLDTDITRWFVESAVHRVPGLVASWYLSCLTTAANG